MQVGSDPQRERPGAAARASGAEIVRGDPGRGAAKIAPQDSRRSTGSTRIHGADYVRGARPCFRSRSGMAATWNPELMLQASRITARSEHRAPRAFRGASRPVLDVGRQPLWPRLWRPSAKTHLATVMWACAADARLPGHGPLRCPLRVGAPASSTTRALQPARDRARPHAQRSSPTSCCASTCLPTVRGRRCAAGRSVGDGQLGRGQLASPATSASGLLTDTCCRAELGFRRRRRLGLGGTSAELA